MRETDGLVDLYVDGEVISTTAEHPFWVPDKGWVEAKDLQVGSLLQTDDGRIVDVDRVEKREGKFEVYNFKVEGIPTYFVSDLGILVHNTCGKFPNLFPEDVPNYEIHRNELFFDGAKWRYRTPQGNVYTPDGQYNFIVKDGKTYIGKNGGHIDLSGGQDVDFAGQVRFGRHKDRGILKYWDNGSGHYKPPADAAPNAPFPLDLFRMYFE